MATNNPEITVIRGSQELSRDECKNSHLSISESKLDKTSLINNKSSNTKENNESKICSCKGGNCNGSQRRMLDENGLKELLLFMENQYPKCKGDTNCELSLEEWAQFYSFPRLLLSNNTNENHLDPFVMQPSLFHKNNVPPTIFFNTKLNEDSKPPIGLPKHLQSYFKWKISSITPNTIRNCIAFMKFEVIKPSNTVDNTYLGSWCKHMLTAEFSQLEEWRKVNHYPGSFHLGRKDKLWYRIRLANLKYGPDKFDNFHPTTFVMPKDYHQLCDYWRTSPSKLFIMKPPASARGNGIQVINDISQIPANVLNESKKSTMIVQQYISNPCLLENGQKFDLRVYVLITSVDPLRIYVYDEGLVRFASSKYTSQEDGIIDQYMHLTNYFINKNNQEYEVNNDCDSLNGCKWTLKRFWRYLRDHYTHIDAQQLWDKIVDIIIKTIICCEGPMTRLSHQNCKNDYTSFELFGFDIILDENFRPWILEVNITPSLKSESNLDTKVKYGVIKDMFNLVGYNLPPKFSDDLPGVQGLTDNNLFFNSRLYTEVLTKKDRTKHSKYQKISKYEQGMGDSFDSRSTQGLDLSNSSSQEFCRNGQTNQVPKIEELEINGYMSEEPKQQLSKTLGGKGLDGYEHQKQNSDGILEDLSQNDARILMLAEDELSRSGQFKRVFPSSTSSKYLKYFDRPRYYNLLLDAWERKYHGRRLEGINRLSNIATFLN